MYIRTFLFLCGASCVAAQSTPSLPLDDAIRLAWANDRSVASLSLLPEVALAREEQAGLRPNPDVEFRGGIPVKGDSEWALGVGVNQRIPRRERVARARALARLAGASAELQIREQRRLVAGEVRRLYYEVAVQQARRDLARRTLAAHRELRDAVERRRAAGEIAGAETDLFALETARAEQALAFADADLAATTQRLRGRLRMPAPAPFALQASLDAVLSRPLPSPPAATSLDSVRPTLALAAHHVREAEAAVALARAETRGDWTVGGGLDFERRSNDFTGRLENEPRLSLSASAPWPRAAANRGNIREKQAALRIAEAELAALRETLEAEIAAASATARELQPVLAAHRDTLAPDAALPESLRATFERGEVTSLQLAQARQQRFAMETEFLNAATRYAAALAEAETAAGVLPSLP